MCKKPSLGYVVENQGLEVGNAREDAVVRQESGSPENSGGCGLNDIGRTHSMVGAKSGCEIGNPQIRGNPCQVRITDKQAVIVTGPVLAGVAVRVYQYFGHGEAGGHRLVTRLHGPRKYCTGCAGVAQISLQFVDEDVSVQRETAMAAQERVQELGSSQLCRSFSR
jgi:hypothetical protein